MVTMMQSNHYFHPSSWNAALQSHNSRMHSERVHSNNNGMMLQNCFFPVDCHSSFARNRAYNNSNNCAMISDDDNDDGAFPLPFQEVTFSFSEQEKQHAEFPAVPPLTSSSSVALTSIPRRVSTGADEASSTSASHLLPGRALPDDFTPRPWSVIVGRDKASLEAPGNKRLHVVIGWYLQRYVKSHKNKEEKSRIISEIESTIRSACSSNNDDPRASFVKFQDGKWYQVESSTVREKISRLLRETLHTKYSSSSRRKRERKRHRRQSQNSNNTSKQQTTSNSDNSCSGSSSSNN